MSKKAIVAAAAFAGTAFLPTGMAAAQTVNTEALSILSSMPAGGWPKWFPPMLNQALSITVTKGTPVLGGTLPPPVIPQSEKDIDPTGLLGSYQPGKPTVTLNNAFFQSLGTNGRTCFSCHQPSSGMGISTATLQNLYKISGDIDPVFAAVDGANCPNTPHNHSLLLNKGLFRIFLPVPANAEFTVTVVSDPTGCNTNPTYSKGVDPTTGLPDQIVSVYRRPLVATNLKFVTDLGTPPVDPITGLQLPTDLSTGLVESGNIMWDGREQTLQTQAFHATAGHAQANQAQLNKLGVLNAQGQITQPPSPEMTQIVAFEDGIFSAQLYDFVAGSLSADGATGGPVNLAAAVSQVPDTTDPAFALYTSWSSASGARQQSIYRGMEIFLGKNKPFSITNVAGIDNIVPFPGSPPLQVILGQPGAGSCSTCHSVPNSGSDTFRAAQHDIGIGGTSVAFGGPAPSPDLPIFQVTCKNGLSTPYHGGTVVTNEIGMAMISGKCADIGRLTVAPLRGLAARAPYFSDGSAATLLDVVNFYNQRFSIGLTDQDKQDLVNFLSAL
ncbi:MAG: hypothetical protein ACLP7P_06820 [Rhodomicrobium sp.]